MKILKWVVHPVFVLVVIIAVAIYFNRADLLSTIDKYKSSSEVSSEQQAVEVQPAEPSPEQQAAEVESAEPSPEQQAAEVEPAEPLPMETPATQLSVAESSVVPEISKFAESAPAETAMPATDVQQPVASAINDSATPAQSEATTAEMTDDVIAAVSPEEQASAEALAAEKDVSVEETPESGLSAKEAVRHLQFEAHRATFQGKLDEAVSSYQQIIEIQPHNHDAYGELGDIYMRMGSTEKAVEAYSNATELLFRSNRKGMAWRVLNYIGRISPEKAQELRSRLNER